MPPPLKLNAVAFISPSNTPILIRTFTGLDDLLKYHHVAHTSLDVFDERVNSTSQEIDSYLGFMYAMEDDGLYGYVTSTRIKIVIALALSDVVVREADMLAMFKTFYLAYYRSAANPFLNLLGKSDPFSVDFFVSIGQSDRFRRRVEDIAKRVNESRGEQK